MVRRTAPTPTDRLEAAADAVTEPLASAVRPSAVRRWTRGDTWRSAVAGSVLVLTGLAAWRGLSPAEIALFRWVNDAPDATYWILWPIMQLGNVAVAVVVALAVGLVLRRWRVALMLAAAPLLAWEVAKLVKALVERGRPVDLLVDVHQRGVAELGYGFVSGHATVAFALAGALAAHLRRRWTLLLFVVAGLVAVARIYVGVHLPLDVLGGAAAGLLIGEAFRAVEVLEERRPQARRSR